MDNKKKINIKLILIIISIIVIVTIIFFLIKFKVNSKNNIIFEEEIIKIVDANNNDNVEVKDNIKTNISKKVIGTTEAVGVSDNDIDGKVCITDVLIKSNIEDDTCTFSGIVHNNTGKDIETLFINFRFYMNSGVLKDGAEKFCYDLKKGETCELKFNMTTDISNIEYYEIEYSDIQ